MKWKNNNEGLSLIELIVAMAIVLIVGASIISLMVVGMKQYRSSSSEVDIQYEAQLANNQMRDMLIDVSAGLGYYVSTGSELASTLSDDAYAQSVGAESAASVGFTNKYLCFYNWDNTTDPAGKTVTMLSWDKDEETIQFSEYTYTSGNGINQSAEKNLMAEYVTDFSVDLSKAQSSKEVSYSITFEKNGRTYKAENNVTLRNDITINNDEEAAIFKEITEKTSIVNKVTISPGDGVVVVQGGTQQFKASVTGENFPGQRVIWSLNEEDKPYESGTKIDPNSGLLTLDPTEKSQDIKVVATSAGVGLDGEHISESAIASARYLEKAEFMCTTTKGNTQTASLSFEGKNLDKGLLDGDIPVTITPSINGVVTNKVTINKGNLEDGNQKELLQYKTISITCDDIAPETEVIITAEVGKYGGFEGYTKSFKFTTASAKEPITSAIIVSKGSSSEYDGLTDLRRGENLDFEVLVKRGEDGSYQTIKEDGHVTLEWDSTLNTIKENGKSYKKYASFTENGDGSISLHVEKNDEIFPYKISANNPIELNATVKDEGETNEKWVDSPLYFSIAPVKIQSFHVPADTLGAGNVVSFTAEVSGIILETGDIAFEDIGNSNKKTVDNFGQGIITYNDNNNRYNVTIPVGLQTKTNNVNNGKVKMYITKSTNTTVNSSIFKEDTYDVIAGNVYVYNRGWNNLGYYIEKPDIADIPQKNGTYSLDKEILLINNKKATFKYSVDNYRGYYYYIDTYYLQLDGKQYEFIDRYNYWE